MPKISHVLGFIAVVALLLFVWVGGFQAVTVEVSQSGPLYGVYLKHYGSYATIPSTLSEVQRYVREKGGESKTTFGMYFQDPKETPDELLVSWVGVITPEPLEVEPPYEQFVYERKDTVRGAFRGHPYATYFKVYKKLEDQMRRLNLDRSVPALETYTPASFGQYFIDVYREAVPLE
jgi:effector-binding domain-containing protein